MRKNAEITIITRLFEMKLSRTLLIFFFLAGLLPPLVFRAFDWYNGAPLSAWPAFIQTLLISAFSTLVVATGVVQVLKWLQQRYPWNKSVVQRLVLELTLTTGVACILIIALTYLLYPITRHEDFSNALFNNLIVALIMNAVLVLATEGVFFFRQWRDSAVTAERYKKESIRAQLESLRNQVNPHFLFNSLNTLSSLIDLDKELSKEFLDDLSTVYRYVLQHKDEEVVKLSTELDFINSFTQLLKVRHIDGLHFHFDIPEEALSKGLPPMTLQLLVENAVKHNIASRNKPLTIEIIGQGNGLAVRNKLQRKRKVQSTNIGLNNIRSRYQYLIEQDIEVNEDGQYFEVRIPLITLT